MARLEWAYCQSWAYSHGAGLTLIALGLLSELGFYSYSAGLPLMELGFKARQVKPCQSQVKPCQRQVKAELGVELSGVRRMR